MTDLSLLTFNYNTPKLINSLLISFFNWYKNDIQVVIFENSDKIYLSNAYYKLFNVIDNKNYKITNNQNGISRNHCACIDYALKKLIKTKYCLICDSDITFLADVNKLIDLRYNYDIIGHITYEEYVKPERIHPCFCIIDVEKFNNEYLNYYDPTRCIVPNLINLKRTYIKYDTGASFLEDIKNKWKIKHIDNTNDFYIHHGKGSHLEDN